jgi:hypothetical protein
LHGDSSGGVFIDLIDRLLAKGAGNHEKTIRFLRRWAEYSKLSQLIGK